MGAPLTDPKLVDRAQRAEVRVRVKLQFGDKVTFSERFSQNISRTGIFIRASQPAPVGARVHFEYSLANDTRILRGLGIVRRVKMPEDVQDPQDPPGMGIEFIDLDAESEALIEEIVRQRGEGARAPKKAPAKKAAAPLGLGSGAGPIEENLLPEEENALDALLGGEPPPKTQTPTPPPAASQPANKAPAKAAPAPTPTAAGTTLILDISGADWLCAQSNAPGSPLSDDSMVSPRFSALSEKVSLVEAQGSWLPSLASWLGRPYGSPRVTINSRWLGLLTTHDDEGGIAVVIDKRPIPIKQLVQAALEKMLAGVADPSSFSGCTVLIPSDLTPTGQNFLTEMLQFHGIDNISLTTRTAATCKALQQDVPDGNVALFELSLLETRISLLAKGQPHSVRADLHTGLLQVDKLVRDQAVLKLLREHGVDAADDPSLLASVFEQLMKARREHLARPWNVTIAGASISVDDSTLRAWTESHVERMALLCEEVCELAGTQPRELAQVLIVPDECPWPHLATTLEEVIAAPTLLLDPDPWLRIRGNRP